MSLMLPTILFMSSRLGWMSWRRLNASNWRVSAGGALGGLGDLLRGTRRRFIKFGRAEERCVAVDDGENVVEVVRDAAGELADGLHFLRLAELLLQPPLRRDIAEQTQHERAPVVNLDE